MASTSVAITVDAAAINAAIKEAARLVEILRETQAIIQSFSTAVVGARRGVKMFPKNEEM